jgi:HSP20 family protein
MVRATRHEKPKGTGAVRKAGKEGNTIPSPFEEMDRMVEDFFARGWMPRLRWPQRGDWELPFERRLLPRVDIIDRDDALVLRAQIPGVKKEDLDISVTDNTVTIKGSTSHEEKEEKGEYYRRECSHGSFIRTIALPDNVDTAKAKASFKNGMLDLSIPKIRKTERRNISIS